MRLVALRPCEFLSAEATAFHDAGSVEECATADVTNSRSWNSIAGTLIVEVLMFVAGAAIYLTSTRAKDKIGSIALWAFLVFLLLVYFSSALSAAVPTAKKIGWSAVLMWLFVRSRDRNYFNFLSK